MLISDFIKSKLGKFGVMIDDNELEGLLLKNSISTEETYTIDTVDKTERAMYDYLPEMLIVSSIQEGGYSISYDREGILAYYRLLCNNLGLPDKVSTPQPKIKNRSNFW